jgi:hypothetical protein
MYDKDKAEARITKLHREIAQVKYWLDAMEPHLHKPHENNTVDNNNALSSISSSMLSMQVRIDQTAPCLKSHFEPSPPLANPMPVFSHSLGTSPPRWMDS